jgi:RNase P/RNase MRP subunit p30
MKGEKVRQIDIIYVRESSDKVVWETLNWPQFSLLTHTWVGTNQSINDGPLAFIL